MIKFLFLVIIPACLLWGVQLRNPVPAVLRTIIAAAFFLEGCAPMTNTFVTKTPSAIVQQYGDQLLIVPNQEVPTPITIIRAWTPEERAQATSVAIANYQTTISPQEIPNYDLVVLSTTFPITADKVVFAQGIQGVELILDAAGNVVGFAAHTALSALIIPGMVLGATQDTIEGHPEYTPWQLAQLRGYGWRQVIFNDIDISNGVITDVNGKVIATINQDAVEGKNSATFNSDQGGQTANPNPDQFKPPERSPEQERVDILLSEDLNVDIELLDTSSRSNQTRVPEEERDPTLSKPPRFRYVSEYNISVYDIRTGKIYEGKWNDNHTELAMSNGLMKITDDPYDMPFFNGAVFSFRGAPGVRIFQLDRLWLINAEDLQILQNGGYQVMGPEYQWLVLNSSSPNGYTEIPSAISR